MTPDPATAPFVLPTWAGPIVLALELFLLVSAPVFVLWRSGMFSMNAAFQVALVVGATFYAYLPDPIDVGVVDDVLVAVFLAVLFLPAFRDRLVERLTRRPRPGSGSGIDGSPESRIVDVDVSEVEAR